MPNSINLQMMMHLHDVLIPSFPAQLRDPIEEMSRRDWSIFAVDQQRGRCYPTNKEITIPVWAFKEIDKGQHRVGYIEWYVAHEVSHAWDFMNKTYDYRKPHGVSFMKLLETFCPREFLVYEINYKPRNVRSSGIILMDVD